MATSGPNIEQDNHTHELMKAQLYAQKFLSYLIAYISCYIIYLTIIFEMCRKNSTLFLRCNIAFCRNISPYKLLSFPFLILLTVFGLFAYRTFIGMYAIEKKIETIKRIEDLAKENIPCFVPLYKTTGYFSVPGEEDSEKRLLAIWIFLLVLLLSIFLAINLWCRCLSFVFVLVVTLIIICEFLRRPRKEQISEQEEKTL